jgi:hypothetical protein
VTGGCVAAAVQQRRTTAIVNAARVIAPVHIIFLVAVWRAKETQSIKVRYWEIIADRLSALGWS